MTTKTAGIPQPAKSLMHLKYGCVVFFLVMLIYNVRHSINIHIALASVKYWLKKSFKNYCFNLITTQCVVYFELSEWVGLIQLKFNSITFKKHLRYDVAKHIFDYWLEIRQKSVGRRFLCSHTLNVNLTTDIRYHT